MRQAFGLLEVAAPAVGLFDITNRVTGWLAEQGLASGLLTLFCRHTSASLLIQENAAPAASPRPGALLRPSRSRIAGL